MFSKDVLRPDGLTGWCKACRSAHYKGKREAILAQQKEYGDKNRAARRAYSSRYYQENREKVLEGNRRAYYANVEEIKARHRAYNKVYLAENPEMNLAKTQRRRATKRSNGVFAISKKELKKLYNSPCFYCDKPKAEHLDHVVPIRHGGRHSIGNLLPACSECNMSKGSKFLSQWKRDLMKYGGNKRKFRQQQLDGARGVEFGRDIIARITKEKAE